MVAHDVLTETRGWKLFILLPNMLLRRPSGFAKVGKDELCRRFDKFVAGEWVDLIREGHQGCAQEGQVTHHQVDSVERRAVAACQKIKFGEVSRARQCLTGAPLAPGTEEIFQILQARRPQIVGRALPEEVQAFELESPVIVDRQIFLKCLKAAPRGASPGPGGCTFEHLKVLLDDTDTMELLFVNVTRLARAKVPVEISEVLMGARFTALAKFDGGIREIATGSSLRRFVARILATQFMRVFEKECAPKQYALSTRAGTDCVGHLIRASTDANPTLIVLSVDGIGAYDHVYRSAMLGRLLHMPAARTILPFVRLSYGSNSSYTWMTKDDSALSRKSKEESKGTRSCHCFSPLAFKARLNKWPHPWSKENICALTLTMSTFSVLQNAWFLCTSCSARCLAHQGKTKVWNQAGRAPEDELGPEVWRPQGLKILGTPIGTPEFVSQIMNERIEDERRFWETILSVPDLQCAWQLLVQSANPRANHSLRTMPPSCTAEYARAHDQGLWQTVETLLHQPGTETERTFARDLAIFPIRMGGLGLRSATRCAQSAFWASWADALPMIRERTPQVAEMVAGHGGCTTARVLRRASRGVHTTGQGRFLVETIVV